VGVLNAVQHKGLWTGGARPLGYRIDRTSDNLVIDPAEAATVRTIFDLYTNDRLGTQAIATTLNGQGLRTRMGKPWSQHTIELILTNRTYLGEKRFRDITVPDAHPSIIDQRRFDQAQRILGIRSAEIGKRAANPSDYTLTGKIRCPQCGRRYVGTAARGRHKTYRYYTCWSRARYGTGTGCDVHRFNADDLEAAIGAALLDFYTTGSDIIASAVAEFQRHHAASTLSRRDQIRSVEKELAQASTAIDRYLAAFEKGTLDDEDSNIHSRLTTLKNQTKTLRARKAQLELDLDQPAQLSPADLAKIHNQIRQILTDGAPQARKALFEALIHEITVIADDTVRPVFKLPLTSEDERLAQNGPASTATDTADQAVRALPTMVGDTGIEPVTSSVSRKRAPAAPIARTHGAEVGTGFEPAYTALQAVASPLGHPTEVEALGGTLGGLSERTTGFEPATLTLAR
jgi:site-specific DNA recombinase